MLPRGIQNKQWKGRDEISQLRTAILHEAEGWEVMLQQDL